MKISGKTKICGIIGDPVEHTLSPIMQNAAFKIQRLDYVYVAFKVKKEGLRNAIRGIQSLGVYGFNVTMPHKNAIVNYLDELDSNAKLIGTVNTVVNVNGRLVGFNTDGFGAFKALKENGVIPKGKKLLLLGAGGAANSIAFQSAQEVGKLVILNRTVEKAERLAKTLSKRFNKCVFGYSLTSSHVKEEIKDSDILINATSVGMYPHIEQSPILPEWLRPDLCVMDIIYNPLETKLAKDARACGAKVISGIEMLIYQGASSFEIWTNKHAPIKAMKRAVISKLSEIGATY